MPSDPHQRKRDRLRQRSRALVRPALAVLLWAAAGGAQAMLVHPAALGFERLRNRPDLVDRTAELHCLALNVYHEARSEPIEGKFAVAAVTMNRVHSAHFPGSVCEVVWQPGQFSWTNDGKPDKPYNLDAWKEALWVATLVFEFHYPSPVGDALYYHATYVKPDWVRTERRVRRVGTHIFYAPRGG